jgi:hypothetical protein
MSPLSIVRVRHLGLLRMRCHPPPLDPSRRSWGTPSARLMCLPWMRLGRSWATPSTTSSAAASPSSPTPAATSSPSPPPAGPPPPSALLCRAGPCRAELAPKEGSRFGGTLRRRARASEALSEGGPARRRHSPREGSRFGGTLRGRTRASESAAAPDRFAGGPAARPRAAPPRPERGEACGRAAVRACIRLFTTLLSAQMLSAQIAEW